MCYNVATPHKKWASTVHENVKRLCINKKKKKTKQKGPAWTLPNEPEKKPSKE